MNREPLKLGKIKNGIFLTLALTEEGDKTVYVLSESLNDLSLSHPNNYLKILEGMKDILCRPDMVSFENKTMRLYKSLYKNDSLYLLELTLIKKEKWLYQSLKSVYSVPMPDKPFRMHK